MLLPAKACTHGLLHPFKFVIVAKSDLGFDDLSQTQIVA